MAKFIVVILDSFGVGAMEDVHEVRKEDIGANTALHILQHDQAFYFPTLEQLGLINLLPCKTINGMSPNVAANVGTANLTHFGADSFAGHQEIMGTKSQKPVLLRIQEALEYLQDRLNKAGYAVQVIEKVGLQCLLVNNSVLIADNMETDLGQVINVSGLLDELAFADIVRIGQIVRASVEVSRVIVLGGRGVKVEQMLEALVMKAGYIGLDTPLSGLYNDDYHVIHLGYGVDYRKQVPYVLDQVGVPTVLVGKVGDIVYNPQNRNFPGVDTTYLFDIFIEQIKQYQTAFLCLNIQETDLAGHAEDTAKYAEKLVISDQKLAEIIPLLATEDVLVVMADHGNDPTVGHSKHTREQVPLLIYQKNIKGRIIGRRQTMADVGATVADFFGCTLEYGTSFLADLES